MNYYKSRKDDQLLQEAYINEAAVPSGGASEEQCLRTLGQVMMSLEEMIQSGTPVSPSFRPTVQRMMTSIENKLIALPRGR